MTTIPAPAPVLDLDAYFARIGWRGVVRQDLTTLTGLLQAHMANIPFENLDVLLGRPIRLDLASLQDKLVRRRRGGYCFEHVSLFAAVLEALGFAPLRHLARVTLYVPRAQAARTHMFLTVPLTGAAAERYVVDPGFGALASRLPLPLVDGLTQRVGAETFAMVRDAEAPGWLLRAQVGGSEGETSLSAWVSTLEVEHAVDFEMGNHYTASHRDSAFVNRLMLRALTPDGRVTVMNRDVTIWRGQGAERFELADRAALRQLLRRYFGFDLPEVETAPLHVPMAPAWG